MSLTDYFRGLLAPDRSRWKQMLMALALSLAGVEAVAFLEPPEAVSAIIAMLVFAAWFVGACAMVGYVRWFFASELTQARRDKGDAVKRDEK